MDTNAYIPPEVNVEPLGDLMLNFQIEHDSEEAYLDFKETINVGKVISSAKEVFIACPHAPSNQVPCPEDILKTVQTPQELPSFKEFLEARTRLSSLLDSLISLLTDALAKGETDWRLMT